MEYITDAQKKNDEISKLQNGLIMVLAVLVESRDKCTGDHVKNTAEFTRIIIDEMRKEGFYKQERILKHNRIAGRNALSELEKPDSGRAFLFDCDRKTRKRFHNFFTTRTRDGHTFLLP